MNDTYNIADVMNTSEEISLQPEQRSTAKDTHSKDNALEIVATQYAELLWKLYWHKKQAEREAAAKNVDSERGN